LELVPSTLIALIALAAMLVRGPARSVGVFLALTPLGTAAAFNLPALGGATIGVADIGAMGLFALICLTPAGLPALMGAARPFGAGFWLLLLAGYCVVAAMFFPRLFAGETQVFAISRAAGTDGIAVRDLVPTTGNLTQLFRVLLGVMVFAAMATLLRLRPEPGRVVAAMTLATALHAGLGILDVASAAAGLPHLLDPIRTANYAILSDHYMVGMKRMIGGTPEASSFGYYALGLLGFWLAYWVKAPGSRRAPWMLALTAAVLLRSTSSSAYVAAAAFLLTWGLWSTAAHLRAEARRRSVALVASGAMALWFAALALFASYQLVDPVTAFLDRALFDKLDTASGVERMSWNAQAWRNFLETQGVGAGLGSVRASNWLLATLGSLGAIGTALYAAFLVALARTPAPTGPGAPENAAAAIGALKAGCLAMALSALLTHATPDPGLFFFALAGLAAGLSRGAVLESRHASAPRRAPSLRLRAQ